MTQITVRLMHYRHRLAGALTQSARGRFVHGAVWSLIGTVLVQSMTVLAAIATARLLGQTQFGELEMINSTIATFGIVAGMGLGLTANKFVAEYRLVDPVRAGRVITLSMLVSICTGGIIALAMLVAAPWLAANTLNAPQLVVPLQIASALFLLNALNGVQIGVLSGLEAFRSIATVNLQRGLLTFPIIFFGVWYFGLLGAVSAAVLIGVLSWFLFNRVIRRECARAGIPATIAHAKEELPILWRFALPAFLSGIVVTPFLWWANTLLVNQPGGYAGLGTLSATNQWKNLLMLIPTVLAPVTLAIAASMHSQRGNDRSLAIIDLSQSTTVLFAIPTSTLIMFLSTTILGFYGTSFVEGRLVFIFVILGVAFATLNGASGSAVQAYNKMWLGALLNLIWGLCYLALSAALVASYGALGLALSFAGAYYLVTVPQHVYLYRRGFVPLSMVKRAAGVTGFMTVTAATAAIAPPALMLWLALPASLLCFGVCFFVWTPPDIRTLVGAYWRRFQHAAF